MKSRMLVAIGAVAGLAVTGAYGELLTPGVTYFKTGYGTPTYTSGGPLTPLTGMLASMSESYTTSSFTGVVSSQVWRNDLGGMTFLYRVENTSGTATQLNITKMTISGLDAGWHRFDVYGGADGSGTGAHPEDGDPGNMRKGTGLGGLAMDWEPAALELTPGQMSSWMWFEIRDDRVRYRVGTAGVIDGGLTGNTAAFVAYIPLPTAGLMGLAGLGLVVVRRRR